jgi:L-arabinose isomerase
MLTNCLIRRGRPFDLVVGRLEDEDCIRRVREALLVAGVAGGLRQARIGRVGVPIDGYDCVDLDAAAVRAAMGIEIVPIEPGAVLERWRAVTPRQVRPLEEEVNALWERGPGIDDDEALARSLRAAAAMESLVQDYRLDAGAMNCHVPEIRFGSEIGITPCYALGRLTSRGIPWSCAGDALTAVAMLAVKRLGGAAVYHELEVIDYETGECVIANTGEHDLAWCALGERPLLRRNGWYDGVDPRCGVCACCAPAAGSATLVGFTPHPDAPGGFRFVVASGELTARRFPQTGTVNGAFRFAAGPVEQVWTRWVAAGVNHHSCATPGDYAGRVEAVARHLGIGAARV